MVSELVETLATAATLIGDYNDTMTAIKQLLQGVVTLSVHRCWRPKLFPGTTHNRELGLAGINTLDSD